jgi:hypothetical protein
MWVALFCLIGLGPAIAIKVAAPLASLVVEPAQDQKKIEWAVAPNTSAKSDRLELPNAHAEAEIIVPPVKPMLEETPSAGPETVKKVADRPWQDANARAEAEIVVPPLKPMLAETPSTSPKTAKKVAGRLWQDTNARTISAASPSRHAKSRESKKSADTSPSNARPEVWHCRQDAVGGLLRSLDLSPRCNL